MDTATAELSPVSGWTAKAPTSTLDEATGVTQTTHRFYVKQVIHDADFFVEATVVITDPEKYNAAVKNRLSEMLQGTWLSAPAPTD